MSDTDMAYAYRIPGCGCVVAAQVDRPEYRRDVAQFKRDKSKQGFVLFHGTVADVRAMPWGWPCEHMKAAVPADQLVLDTERASRPEGERAT